MLQNSLGPLVGINVISKPPDLIELKPFSGLNLFLYHVASNTAYQSLDSPTRNTEGELIKTPVLALNLNYLLTAYTMDKSDLQDIYSQQILAKAMLTIHENPIITKKDIQTAIKAMAITPHTDTGDDLDTQIEMIKVSLANQSFEEMTKIWSSFFQTHYRLSVSCTVTVILLSTKKMDVKPGLPVQQRNILVLPFRRPVIDRIEPHIVERNSILKYI